MRSAARKLARALAGGLVLTAAVGSLSIAQPVPAGRGLTLVVGRAAGTAVTERLDPSRANRSSAPLPVASLRVGWSRQLRPMRSPPLVTEDGTVIVVTDQGDTVLLAADGSDSGHASIGPGPMSAPTLLADGTLAVVNGLGDVVGVRHTEVAFRTHVFEAGASVAEDLSGAVHVTLHSHGRLRSRTLAPPRDLSGASRSWTLPLDDGGVVVAFERELASLDASGVIRSRATSPAMVASPLVAIGRSVAFVSEGGEAYVWDLTSAAGAVRAHGSFGGGVDGVVAAEDARHLLGVVHGARLVSLDLPTGVAETRATSTGAFTGGLTFAPVGDPSGAVLLQEVTLAGVHVVAIDRDGHATPFPILLTPLSSPLLGDGGGGTGPTLLAPDEAALFSDPAGSVAYATVDGHVGVITQAAKHELGLMPCGSPTAAATTPGRAFAVQPRMPLGFAGLVPAGSGAFVVACESGSVTLVRGDLTEGR